MKPSEILKEIQSGNEFNKKYGICINYKLIANESLSTVMENHGISYNDWPLYSGHVFYPVPYNDNSIVACEQAYKNLKKWSKNSKYGHNRHALLAWLIGQFEAKGA